jgi:hypothetical protein
MEKAHQQEQDKKFEEQGLQKTKGGYVFPGVSTQEVEEALERKQNNFEPPLPKMIGTYMDFEG